MVQNIRTHITIINNSNNNKIAVARTIITVTAKQIIRHKHQLVTDLRLEAEKLNKIIYSNRANKVKNMQNSPKIFFKT